MTTIQRSIELEVPIQRLYIQLTRFDDYPRFLENVEVVRQIDIRHLHWTMKAADRRAEWEAEITEQEENHHIVWHNANDPGSRGRIDMEELGPNLSKVTFTLDAKPGEFSGIAIGETEEEISQQLNRDLENLKQFLNAAGSHPGVEQSEADNIHVDDLDAQTQADLMNQARQPSMRPTPASMSGSPTEVLEDEPDETRVDDIEKLKGAVPSSSRPNEKR